jgi:hypothetical protein
MQILPLSLLLNGSFIVDFEFVAVYKNIGDDLWWKAFN